MGPDVFSFQWARDSAGYSLKDPPKRLRDAVSTSDILFGGDGPLIVRNGGELQYYSPLQVQNLFKEFANTGDSDTEILAFVRRYGFLGNSLSGPAVESEPVTSIIHSRDKLASAVKELNRLIKYRSWSVRKQKAAIDEGLIQEAAINKNIANASIASLFNETASPILSVKIAVDPADERLRLQFAPRSLIGAMWLQFAETAVGSNRLRSCDVCGKIFEQSRVDEIYCSGACKTKSVRNRQALRKAEAVEPPAKPPVQKKSASKGTKK